MAIYTIGYEKLDHETLARIMRKLDATILDVRSKPYGRVRKGWDRKTLTARFGSRYAGNVALGGFVRNDAEAAKRTAATAELARFASHGPVTRKALSGGEGASVILMCQEYNPGDCHRHNAIAYDLLNTHQIDALHLIYTAKNEADSVEVVKASDLETALENDDEYPCDWIDL